MNKSTELPTAANGSRWTAANKSAHARSTPKRTTQQKCSRVARDTAPELGLTVKACQNALHDLKHRAHAYAQRFAALGDKVGLTTFSQDIRAALDSASDGLPIPELTDQLERDAAQMSHEFVEALIVWIQDDTPANRRQLGRCADKEIAELIAFRRALVVGQ